MIRPYQVNSSWWFDYAGVTYGPYRTEESAWTGIDLLMKRLSCPNGSCDE